MNMVFSSLLPRTAANSKSYAASPPARKDASLKLNQVLSGDRLQLSQHSGQVRFSGRDEDHAELWQAATAGETGKVREFLERTDIDPNFQNKWGSTALAAAAVHGHAEIVQALLDKKANPNVQNEAGVSSLMQAARYGHKNVVRLLLKQNANPLLQDKEGNTALIYATAGNHRDTVRLLLKKTKADPTLKNHVGTSALMLARDNDFTGISKDLKRAKLKQDFQALLKKAACWKPTQQSAQE